MGILIKKYRDALDLSNHTGFGDTTHIVNGVEVPLTALAQLKAVCPHWELFDTFMRSEFESATSHTTGLLEGGPKDVLRVQGEKEYQFQNSGKSSNKVAELITVRRFVPTLPTLKTPLDNIDPALQDSDAEVINLMDEEDSSSEASIASTEYRTPRSIFNTDIDPTPSGNNVQSSTTKDRKCTIRAPNLSNYLRLHQSLLTVEDIDKELSLDDDKKENMPEKEEKSLVSSLLKRDLLSAIQEVREKTVKRRKTKIEQDSDINKGALEVCNRRHNYTQRLLSNKPSHEMSRDKTGLYIKYIGTY